MTKKGKTLMFESVEILRLLFLIFVILTFLFVLLSFGLLLEDLQIQEEKNYYKEQMLTMCEITHVQQDMLEIFMPEEEFNLLPNIKEESCEYWVLSGKND